MTKENVTVIGVTTFYFDKDFEVICYKFMD